MDKEKIRDEIEEIISEQCDGTYMTGLENANFLEYGRLDGLSRPQYCANKMFDFVIGLFGENYGD